MGQIQVKDLAKSYDKTTEIFHDFNLDIPDGSFSVILGPSGCGKSTLLRMIAGLEAITDGELFIADQNITSIPPKDRNIAMVFQNYALYPHMSVTQNIEYSLKIRKVPASERKKSVKDALEIVGLTDHAGKRPAQLSGGQQQRVALARAIVKKPEVFLMDEPLSNLDAKLRNQMREMLSLLHQELKTTFVFVTHDQAEAMSLADNIILLNKGKIMQQGSPKNLYTDPENIFVAKFIGNPPTTIWSIGDQYCGIKPEDIMLNPGPDASRYYELEGTLISFDTQGSEIVYRVQTRLGDFHVKTTNNWQQDLEVTHIHLPKDKLLFFDEQEQRIRDEGMIEELLSGM